MKRLTCTQIKAVSGSQMVIILVIIYNDIIFTCDADSLVPAHSVVWGCSGHVKFHIPVAYHFPVSFCDGAFGFAPGSKCDECFTGWSAVRPALDLNIGLHLEDE